MLSIQVHSGSVGVSRSVSGDFVLLQVMDEGVLASGCQARSVLTVTEARAIATKLVATADQVEKHFLHEARKRLTKEEKTAENRRLKRNAAARWRYYNGEDCY